MKFADYQKVLGMNARSRIYMRGNRKKYRKKADDKLATKKLLEKNSIGTANLISVIHTHNEAKEFDWDSLPDSFVLKPNRGFGGEGILVIFNRLKNGKWLTTNKRELSAEDIENHVYNILDGNYSLLNTPDTALFEARLSMDPLFKRFSSQGIPDIRVIVYNSVPVMAMLRMPTKKSNGKANLQQGGVGIGIDVTTGITTHAVTKAWLGEKEIDVHPDTGLRLRGVSIPFWDDILKTAVLSARFSKLKYTGVDISVDKKRGPVVLEMNARPGLGIQVANMIPLRDRLRRIRGLKVDTPERGIAIANDLFSGQFDAEVSNITGRKIIGLIEPITLYGKDDFNKKMRAKIDTGADVSSVDIDLAREMGYGEAIDLFESLNISPDISLEEARELEKELSKTLQKENRDIKGVTAIKSSNGVSLRIRIPLVFILAGYRISAEATVVDRSHLSYPVLIGKRQLSQFLIDTTKSRKKSKQK